MCLGNNTCMTDEQLYVSLPKATDKIVQRLRFASHWQPNEIASKLVLWRTTLGTVSRGRKPTDYIDNTKETLVLTK